MVKPDILLNLKISLTVKLILLMNLLTLCGCIYSPLSNSSCNNNCPPQVFASQGLQWDNDSLTKFGTILHGYLESTVLGNHLAVWVEIPSQKLILSMPSPNVFLNNWSAQVSELPGTQIRAFVDAREHSFVEIRFPLYLLTEKFEKFPEKFGLPTGEALPGVPQQRLAKINIPMDKNFRAHLYFGEGVVGLLVDVPYDPMIRTSVPIKRNPATTEIDNTLGYVSTVPKESLDFGGIFMSVVIPPPAMELLGK